MKTLRKFFFLLGTIIFAAQAHAVMYQARPYDPNLARWISRDPIGENGGINLFAFVENNPVSRVDPLGTEEVPVGEGEVTLPGALGDAQAAAQELENINALEGMAGESDAVLNEFNNIDEVIQEAGPFKRLSGGELQGKLEGDINAIFNRLAQGGERLPSGAFRLKDGTEIFMHTSTKTGVLTLDINKAEIGGEIYKIRFPL
jgi:RHS repeat-associated protein